MLHRTAAAVRNGVSHRAISCVVAYHGQDGALLKHCTGAG